MIILVPTALSTNYMVQLQACATDAWAAVLENGDILASMFSRQGVCFSRNCFRKDTTC
jgi:hypothetical protein